METAIRIPPSTAQIMVGARSFCAHTLWLGGVPRGAAILLLDTTATDYDVAEAMNELAGHGYESLAVTDPAELDDDARQELLDGLVQELAGRGWSSEQIGVVGFGSGGRTALLGAAGTVFGGAVSVAPTPITDLLGQPDRLGNGAGLSTPWLGMFGSDDVAVSRNVLAMLSEALAPGSPVYTELVRYPGVAGGFFHDSHIPLVHAAAFDSWQRIIEWFDARVVPRPTPLARAWQDRQLVG